MINRDRVLSIFSEYVSDYDASDPKIRLKIDHTYRVAEHCEEIARSLGMSDEEIDFESIDKLENSHNAHTRDIDYAGINRWTNCKNGLIALSWMLYPDGRYFADEDGFGMEDNDEVTVYCVMNEDLEVIRPFAPVEDVPSLLAQLSRDK